MMTKTKYKLIAVIILAALTTSSVFADDKAGTTDDSIGVQAFGESTLTDIKPVRSVPQAKAQDKEVECLSFEASFSEPLNRKPSAILDIERHFVNMVNAFLEVTKISDNKYRMALTAKTAASCPKLEDDSRVTISTYSGEEAQNTDRQTLPQAITFKAEKNKLKKE